MKKLFTFFTAILFAGILFAQSPQKLSYQAVIRDASNKLVVNHQVGMQISVVQSSEDGTVVYTETQTPTTNANGLVSIEIGGGAGFATIDWAYGPYFIKTETDPAGGTSYTITGVSQLLSVPYALYAEKSGSPGPQGDKGDKGDKGDQGPRGIQGYDGDNGLTTSVNGVTQINGAITLTKSDIGLGSVDNTSDANKPISSDTQTALNLKVDKVTGKGLSTEDYSTAERTKLAGIATGAQVNVKADWNAVSGDAQILNKPALFTTSDETDPLYAASPAAVITNAGSGVVISNAERTKLAGIAAGAEVNVQADWNAVSGDAQILNKPALFTNSNETDPVYAASQAASITNAGSGVVISIAERTKLAGIAAEAEVNVQADWNAISGDAQILNKPTIPAAADGSETKVTAGTNVTVTGAGTTASPYVVNATGATPGTVAGQMQYWNGTAWVTIAPTQNEGATLQMIGRIPTWTGGTPPPVVSDNYKGGIVAYILQSSDPGYVEGETHGLIVATSDQSTGIAWITGGSTTSTLNGNTSPALGTGQANTTAMMNQTDYTGGAAQVCADYSVTVGGVTYNDWYLPSDAELVKLYEMKVLGHGGFTDLQYWSSTENAAANAILRDFWSGWIGVFTKGNLKYVRAIRSF